MNVRQPRWRSLAATITVTAGAVCLALAGAACGGPSGAPSAPSASATGSAASIPAGLTGSARAIAANWVEFFSPATPVATKESLLQNGPAFAAVLRGQATSSMARSIAAQVTGVTLTSGTAADVTWNLLLSGAPALTSQKGTAVYQDGAWKVAAASFCGLLALDVASAPLPAACKS